MVTGYHYYDCDKITFQLNTAGVLAANCNESTNYLPLMEELYSRLELHDTLKSTRASLRHLFRKNVYKVNYCAWMNNYALGNCEDPQSYNQSLRNKLATVCDGECYRNSDSTIELCTVTEV